MDAIRKYDIVRDSDNLRELVKMKMNQRGLSTYKLAEILDLDRGNLNQWLSGLNSKQLRQYDVILIANYLGILIDIKITIV